MIRKQSVPAVVAKLAKTLKNLSIEPGYIYHETTEGWQCIASVSFQDKLHESPGTGKRKLDSQEDAARNLSEILKKEGVIARAIVAGVNSRAGDYTSALNEVCQSLGIPKPEYVVTETAPKVFSCTTTVKAASGIELAKETGVNGRSKPDARCKSARLVLIKLRLITNPTASKRPTQPTGYYRGNTGTYAAS